MVKLKPKNYASFVSCKENGTKIINVDIKNDIQIFDVTSKKLFLIAIFLLIRKKLFCF